MDEESSITKAIFENPIDYICQQLELRDSKKVIFYIGAQINNYPHLGTISTIGIPFAIAKELLKRGFESRINFTFLDNIYFPKDKPEMTRLLKIADRTSYNKYRGSFQKLLSSFSEIFDIDFDISDYGRQQSSLSFRVSLQKILSLDLKDILKFDPSSKRGHNVGTYCPKCFTTNISQPSKYIFVGGKLIFEHTCSKHGTFELPLEKIDYLDTGALIRNIIKEHILSIKSKKDNSLRVIVKGSDWAPLSSLISEGLNFIGTSFQYRPIRIFTPLIINKSGVKISKSSRLNIGEKLEKNLRESLSGICNNPGLFYRNLNKDYFK